jgi:osmotically-inducible protein OsmY
MAETSTAAVRSDLDIRDDVLAVIVTYPPTAADRHHIRVEVTRGQVTLWGHTRTPINRTYLNERVPSVRGVVSVDTSGLYDDDSICREAGRVLPDGLIANSQHGIVVLSGKATAGVVIDDVAQRIAALPGVAKVVTRL